MIDNNYNGKDLYYELYKIGVAGPVGSGKTALIEALTRKMAKIIA